jgi:hypothetical protein
MNMALSSMDNQSPLTRNQSRISRRKKDYQPALRRVALLSLNQSTKRALPVIKEEGDFSCASTSAVKWGLDTSSRPLGSSRSRKTSSYASNLSLLASEPVEEVQIEKTSLSGLQQLSENKMLKMQQNESGFADFGFFAATQPEDDTEVWSFCITDDFDE